MKRMIAVFFTLAFISFIMSGFIQAADKYPSDPINYVIQSKAGGSSDAFVRKLVSIAKKHSIFDVPIVVVNKPGSSGAVAYGYVKKEKGNPYVIANTTQVTVGTSIRTDVYDVVEDFTPIAQMVVEPTAVIVKGDSPYNTVNDLVEAAKAKPGEIKWAGANVGSKNQILIELTQKAGDCQFTFVPYDSDNQGRAAVMGGHVAAVTNQVRDVIDLHKAGEVKILAVAAEDRLSLAPDVPTFREAGYDVVLVQSRGVIAPADIPDEAKNYLGAKFKEIFDTPEFKEFATTSGMGMAYLSPDEWGEELKKKVEFWTGVYKDLGML